MLAVLLIGGIGLLLAGLLAIGFGIPVKEFSFGNTMILAGAIVSCTGVMMITACAAVRDLKKALRQLQPGITADSNAIRMSGALNPAGTATPEDAGFSFGREEPPPTVRNAERSAQSETQPHASWLEEPAQRDRGDVPREANPGARGRRNLLFSSSSRRERERAQGQTGESSLGDFSPGTPLTSPQEHVSEGSTEAPPAQSEDVWEKPGSGRTEPPPQRRGSRGPLSSQPAGQTEDQPPVTVLKSGVVDGMAYSLYSDGSIEAQMPEGMMRFTSIDELRAHLDHRP